MVFVFSKGKYWNMREKYCRGILDTCLQIEKISRKDLCTRILSVRNFASFVKKYFEKDGKHLCWI